MYQVEEALVKSYNDFSKKGVLILNNDENKRVEFDLTQHWGGGKNLPEIDQTVFCEFKEDVIVNIYISNPVKEEQKNLNPNPKVIKDNSINSSTDFKGYTPNNSNITSVKTSIFSAKGRQGRLSWFLTQFSVIILFIGVFAFQINSIFQHRTDRVNSIFDADVAGFFMSYISFDNLFVLFSILILQYVSIVSSIKRFHDMNKTGWFVLITFFVLFIPVIGLLAYLVIMLILLFVPGSNVNNQYNVMSCTSCKKVTLSTLNNCTSCGKTI